MPRGGARPNTGPKPGSKHAATLSKEKAREAFRELVMRHWEPMVQAQIAHSQGIAHMMLRGKDGKFERATDPEQIAAALNSGDENSYYIFTKDPSVQAFTDLMNRTLDKPAEQAQQVDVTLKGDDLLKKIAAARARLAKDQKDG